MVTDPVRNRIVRFGGAGSAIGPFNADGDLNTNDLADFIVAYFSGC